MTTKPSAMKPHKEKEHIGSLTCETCEFPGNDVKSLKKHVKDGHTCPKCSKPEGKNLLSNSNPVECQPTLTVWKVTLGKTEQNTTSQTELN